MNNKRLRVIHRVLALLVLTGMGVFAQTWPMNSPNPAPISGKEQSARTSKTIGNNVVSNANAIGRQRNASTSAILNPRNYSTSAPAKPLSQTVNGYTVTLYPVYADANRIVLTYTVENSQNDVRAVPPFPLSDIMGNLREVPQPRLSDAQGRTFPMLYPSKELDESLGGSVLVFDSAALSVLPETLDLHLALDVAVPKEPNDYKALGIRGPFMFNFLLPVDLARRIAEVHQIAATYGGTITIDKVVVARREARIFWRRADSNKSVAGCGCSSRLEVGAVSSTPSSESGRQVDWEGLIDAALIDEQGEWTISTWYPSWGNAYYPPQPGPVFHFTVPPLGAPPQPTPTPGIPTPIPLPTRSQSDAGPYPLFMQGGAFPAGKPNPVGSPPPLASLPPSPTPTSTLVPPFRPIFPTSLIPLHQTISGYTVALYPIAADTNRITLYYIVNSPRGESLHSFGAQRNDDYTVTGPRLSATGGRELPLIDVGYPQVASGNPPSGAIEATFDANPLKALSPEVKLHLVVDLNVYNSPSFNLPSGASEPATLPSPFALPTHSAKPATPMPGPFTFDFSMPVDLTRRVAEVNQTVDASGWIMTIERVIVTTSETRIIWRYPESDTHILRCSQLLGKLQIGTWTSTLTDLSGVVESWPSNGRCSYRYPQTSLIDKQGDWTLTVDTWISAFGGMASSSSGPWVFHFDLPPIINSTQPEK